MGPAKEVMSKVEFEKGSETFTPAQIERFENDDKFYKNFLKSTEMDVNSNFPLNLKDSVVHAHTEPKVRGFMTAMLGGDPRFCKALIPDFPLACRRMTPAPGYLEALREPNVSLATSPIRRFVPEGVETEDGEVAEVDVIVCATGFDVGFVPRFPVVGRGGVDLREKWERETPRAYMSCAVEGMPNYFTILGPNAPIAHGSVFTLSEHISRYLASIMRKCQTEGIKAVAPTAGAVADYFEHVTSFMPRTTWSSGCRSWFKEGGGSRGAVTATHPGSRIHFFHMLGNAGGDGRGGRFRGEDWEYVHDDESRGNRFAYLGNGFSTIELDAKADSTWYLGI